ncbi:MAG: transcription termination factor NusA [Spirochaetaceae bacterium]|nr:transcription termination factor NusA [Spirochaetaceae bacterium]
MLPKRLQSPREEYRPGDRIKALIFEVTKAPSGLQIVMSRTHGDFVRCLFELEVPEVYDNTIIIEKIVREPGYRTKIAVSSTRPEVDPVGACVGLKGVRIQAVVREMEGEKIDILRYDPDPLNFIKNALSPAHVQDVIVLDGAKRQALAIVPQDQLSLAIGKQGLNVRLANRLVDRNIDVKTEEQFQEMDIAQEINREASNLFQDIDDDTEEISKVDELPGLSGRLVSLLMENWIEYIESLITMDLDELAGFQGVTEDDVKAVKTVIENSVQIVEDDYSDEDDYEEQEDDREEDQDQEEEDQETFECPECGGDITINMSSCPSCGVGLSFEYEDESAKEESDEIQEEDDESAKEESDVTQEEKKKDSE